MTTLRLYRTEQWEPGIPVYDDETPGRTGPIVEYHHSYGMTHPMHWAPDLVVQDPVYREGVARSAEPGPWSWLCPGAEKC